MVRCIVPACESTNVGTLYPIVLVVSLPLPLVLSLSPHFFSRFDLSFGITNGGAQPSEVRKRARRKDETRGAKRNGQDKKMEREGKGEKKRGHGRDGERIVES